MPRQRVAVVVLGDIGRSPRMQYHAVSLANQAGFNVDLIGWPGEQPCDENPPAIPIMLIAWLVSRIRRCKYVIDWHNYGYTWLDVNRKSARKLGLVHLHKWYEWMFGKLADAHLCVSRAMQNDLAVNWGIHAHVLYDRPPSFFKPTEAPERHQLFANYEFGGPVVNGATAFTKPTGELLENRPALLVSSTSWTADENFDVILDAMQIVDQRVSSDANLARSFPNIRLVVTGKGDLKKEFEAKIAKLNLKYWKCYTDFLPTSDYAKLLGSADLGICLHESSSKLDLPMKAVDMCGAGLPVAALNYNCITELVKDGKNGVLFNTAEELAEHIVRLLTGFPNNARELARLRKEVLSQFTRNRWDANWQESALPIFSKSSKRD